MERKSRQQEISEALMAADMASMSLQKAEELLQKASSWGIWDMLGGGFFSTMFKHNRMDEAQAAMNEARGHLRRLKRELLDVNRGFKDGCGKFSDLCRLLFCRCHS